MSDAENPTNKQPEPIVPQDLPYREPVHPSTDAIITPPPAPDVAPEEEDWETVDFPNAISIDALLVSSEEAQTSSSALSYPAESIQEAIAPGASQPALVAQLQQENLELDSRIEQLETLLHECRQSLQQQRSQALDRQKLLDRRTLDLKSVTGQIEQLSEHIQSATRQIQQQQQQIAYLGTELQTSQEIRAKLERECALTQQQYQEQSQILAQTQTTCRDLRARLHRQQRHTLQFKAALEKCIETPLEKANAIASLGQSTLEDPTDLLETIGSDATAQNLSNNTLFPKADPIKPWSISDSDPEEPRRQPVSELKSGADFSKVRLPLSVKEEMGKPIYSPDHSQEVISASSSKPSLRSPLPEPQAEDSKIEQPVWEDLDSLIEKPRLESQPDRPVISTPTPSPSFPVQFPSVSIISPLTDRLTDRIPDSTLSPEKPQNRVQPEPLLTGNSEVQLLLQAKAFSEQQPVQTPSPVNLPEESFKIGQEQSNSQAQSSSNPGESTESSWPAPIVYPVRSAQKKRNSFSAVELPSFSNKK
jgi:hypothetical protein